MSNLRHPWLFDEGCLLTLADIRNPDVLYYRLSQFQSPTEIAIKVISRDNCEILAIVMKK